METTKILERLYGQRTRKKRRRPLRALFGLRRRALDWTRDHNWSLTLLAFGISLWTLTHIYYYNHLVSLEYDVLAARAQVEASQQKRNHIQRNVLRLLRYYETYERGLMTGVTELRTNRGPEAPTAPADTDDPLGSLGSLVGRLDAVAEQYPALRLTEVVQRFAEAVITVEAEIAIRISEYNTTVNLYTTVLRQFPGFLFGPTLGFEDMPFWEAEDPTTLDYNEVEL